MPPVANIKSTSYLKRHAAQIGEDPAMNGTLLFFTPNGDGRMVMESVKQYQ
jgi:hypothetical protein